MSFCEFFDRYSLTIARWFTTLLIQRFQPRELHHSGGRNPDVNRPQPEDYAALALQTARLAHFLAALPDRERAILRARFGLDGRNPQTLNQVATQEGVTRERIRQIEKRALARLRVPELEGYLQD